MNKCIDAGHDGCPCALAEAGQCLICGKLKGETCDACSWQGVCIYSLYAQNGQKRAAPKTSRPMNIMEKKIYSPAFSVFVLEADCGFCQKAAGCGTYVFVKGIEDLSWYDTPISVLKSEPEKKQIHLGIYGCGPKTSKLLNQEERLLVRGVYRNGLSGVSSLQAYPAQTQIFAKGIAIAPLRNFLDGGERYTKYLKNMKLYVDLDKIGFDFFREYFNDLPVDAIEIKNFSQTDFRRFCEGKEGNVFAFVSPYYVEKIRNVGLGEKGFVYPVKGNFCCGEGVCGACTWVDPQGNTLRRCKIVK